MEKKKWNLTIEQKIFFDQTLKTDLRTYGNIWKAAICQGDDYKPGCSLDYSYLESR